MVPNCSQWWGDEDNQGTKPRSDNPVTASSLFRHIACTDDDIAAKMILTAPPPIFFVLCHRVSPKIPSSRDVDPLVEIDRNVRKLEVFLANSTPPLTVADLRRYLPCTVNVDPYLRKLIRGTSYFNSAAVILGRWQMVIRVPTHPLKSLKVLEFFYPKFKALKVLGQVLESPWIHQVKLHDSSNFVKHVFCPKLIIVMFCFYKLKFSRNHRNRY